MKQQLSSIITKKKQELQDALDKVNEELLDSKGMPKGIEQATKQLILKDKAIFFKSCILAYEDILQEIAKL